MPTRGAPRRRRHPAHPRSQGALNSLTVEMGGVVKGVLKALSEDKGVADAEVARLAGEEEEGRQRCRRRCLRRLGGKAASPLAAAAALAAAVAALLPLSRPPSTTRRCTATSRTWSLPSKPPKGGAWASGQRGKRGTAAVAVEAAVEVEVGVEARVRPASLLRCRRLLWSTSTSSKRRDGTTFRTTAEVEEEAAARAGAEGEEEVAAAAAVTAAVVLRRGTTGLLPVAL